MSKTRSSHFLLRITFNGDLILVFYMWVLNKDLRQQKRALWNNIQLRKKKFYYFWAFAKKIMVSNMILNIMGLYGNVETLVMIVWNPYATHWAHIGNTLAGDNKCEAYTLWVEWLFAFAMWVTNNMKTPGDLTDGSPCMLILLHKKDLIIQGGTAPTMWHFKWLN